MGRIKDLRDKVAKGEATEAELAELKELEVEAEEVVSEKKAAQEAEDKSIESAAAAIAEKAFAKFAEKLEGEVKEEKTAPKVEVKSTRVVMDKSLGEVSVDKLAEIKHVIPERVALGKKNTEITGKTIHFMHALLTNDVQKLQVLTEGTAAAGGYLVPEEFANMIIEDLRDATVMRNLATVMNTNTDTIHLPRLDTRPQAGWRSEGAVKLTSTAQFSELVLTPYSLASIVTLSQELADDATLGTNGSVINYIAGLIVQALAEAEDKAFWTGSGTGRPTGVSTYTVGSRVKGSNFADTIISLYHDLKQGYRGRAVWVGTANVLAQLRQLKDSQNRYLVQDLGATPYGSLLGRPMYEQNDLAQSELYFGDFSYYTIADRQGVSVRVSDEATVGGSSAFEKNLVHVRVEKRVDGELTLTEAVKKITNI